MATYNITDALTNCIADVANPTTIDDGGATTELIYTASAGYVFDESLITLTNVTTSVVISEDKGTATLSLSEATDDITVTITMVELFDITPTLTNCTADATNPTIVEAGGTAELVYNALENCRFLEGDILVTNATANIVLSESDTVATVSLSAPTDDVILGVEAVKVYSISAQFENVTADVTNPTEIITTADSKFTLKEDFAFNAFKIEVTGADHAVMVAGKELTLELANPTTNVSIKVTGYIASTNNDYYEVVDGALYLVYNGRNRMRYNKRWIRKNQVGGN